MKHQSGKSTTLLFAAAMISTMSCGPKDGTSLRIEGLNQAVEVYRDSAGVNHIFAQDEHDLFFAQGYCVARDRLFQMEIWRRQATGTVSEILGSRELSRDIGSRLFKFRGKMKEEYEHYHPHGELIIKSFSEGINAYISEVYLDTGKLPIEFKLLGIRPGMWKPEDVISRHQALLGNVPEEVRMARAILTIGEKAVRDLSTFEPGDPDLKLDPKLQRANLFDSVIVRYVAFRSPLRFRKEDIAASFAGRRDELIARIEKSLLTESSDGEKPVEGSNNWVVSGSRTESGMPILANDPHRAITIPSLRYLVHLNAPGWNVIGAGEPTVPGVSVGHNDNGAWGLTVFTIDGEDLLVYELNPENPSQYKYKGTWEDMQSVQDTILVKSQDPVYVTHWFTRHGPVTLVDQKNLVAYAVQCAWLEPGGAPYLASLRMDQASTWEEFREGCKYSNIPGENMIWADKKGNIGWQVVGIAPIRRTWSGLVPVPGDGSYEWDSYLPILSLPHETNPERGYVVTANENLVPQGYEHRYAVGWQWPDRYRAQRIADVIDSATPATFERMKRLQFDYTSKPAKALVPLLAQVKSEDPKVDEARQQVLGWNFILDKNSVAATIYFAWERKLATGFRTMLVPENARRYFFGIPLKKVVDLLTDPSAFPSKSVKREQFMIQCFEEAIRELEGKLGADRTQWQYGQPNMHHVQVRHTLSNIVDDSLKKSLDVGPLPRGGSNSTPGVTGNGGNQTHGASFRMVVDVSDWDGAAFTNPPGQSGDPSSPYYSNLFKSWANDTHFTLLFSKERIAASSAKTTLRP